MNQEIQTALKELQNQLLQLKPAAEHIKQYEEVAQQAMDSFIGIEQLYGSHLDKVNQGLNLYPTARIIQVAVGFNLRATAAKAINSMITVKSGISTSY